GVAGDAATGTFVSDREVAAVTAALSPAGRTRHHTAKPIATTATTITVVSTAPPCPLRRLPRFNSRGNASVRGAPGVWLLNDRTSSSSARQASQDSKWERQWSNRVAASRPDT